jgi:hypothetical protein
MNELLFFIQIITIVILTLGALRLGKEAMIATICIQALLANLLVLKQIQLFGLTITSTDVFAIGSLLTLNLLQEYFGQKHAKKAAWICFYLLAFFTLISQIHLLFQPSPLDTSHTAYTTILSATPRLMLASLTVFFLVQQFDIRFYSWIQRSLTFLPLMARAGLSLIVSQLLDTSLFTFLGLWGLVANITHILLFSFAIKIIIVFSISPFVQFSKKIAMKTRGYA